MVLGCSAHFVRGDLCQQVCAWFCRLDSSISWAADLLGCPAGLARCARRGRLDHERGGRRRLTGDVSAVSERVDAGAPERRH
eukprot:9217047-Alexandrium_andersonii.AAC.1